MTSRCMCFGLLACVAAAPLGAGQEPEPFRLTVDVPQVVLNVTVLAKDGRPVPGLTAADFLLYDDGKLQRIKAFSALERPAVIGLVLDNSRSMAPIRVEALQAAAAFVDASHSDDDFFVTHFNERVRLGFNGEDFSTDRPRVRMALWQLTPDGQTALYDALRLALDHARKGRWEKRALLVISDGGDTASAASLDDVLRQARAEGTSIYGIGLYNPRDPESSPGVLRALAKAGGGTAFFPDSAAPLASICERIAAEIRSQYTIAFTPSGMGSPGAFHKIRVRVKGDLKGLTVWTREGYYE